MEAMTLGEAITESFYAWEVRGRGWTLAPYPCQLEPPYRPFFLLPGLVQSEEVIDDGRRPTLFSAFVDGVRSVFAPPPVCKEAQGIEEQPPFPADEPDERITLRLHIPHDLAAKPALSGELLRALSTARHPVSLEIVGEGGVVSLQLTCAASDAALVEGHLRGYLPSVSAIEGDDLLHDIGERGAAHVVEFGLSEEFFLPLRSFDSFAVDPYVALIAALERTGSGERLALQVLFTQTLNPWQRAIHDALQGGDGDCLIADAAWFPRAAEEKTAAPLCAASLRLIAEATDADRTLELVRSTQAFFAQYAHPEGNALAPLQTEDADAERLLLSMCERLCFRTGMLLSLDELAGLVHLPGPSVASAALSRSAMNTIALPAVARGHALVLGTNTHRGVTAEASLDHESRFAHTWVIGASGAGKSTLLATMILEDCEAGHGVSVFDPHGDLVDDVLLRLPYARRDDVLLFDPADVEHPIGFNVLSAKSEIERTLLASDLVAILRRFATSWGDAMTTVLAEAVMALLAHPEDSTLLDLKRFLVDDAFRKELLSRVPDPYIRQFWEKEYPLIGARSIGPLITRLDAFLRMRLMRSIVGARDARLDVGACMNDGRILLARLAKGQIGEENARLLGSLLLAKLSEQALMRQAVQPKDRRPFFAYIDECQHFVSPSLESLATEGRKYRVGLTLAHQSMAQLAAVPSFESALLANCHTRIAFRVGDEDAKQVSQGFAHFGADDLRALQRGEAAARIGGAGSDFNLRTRPLAPLPESASERVAAIRAASRARYATTPLPVEVAVVSTLPEERNAQAQLPVELPPVPAAAPRPSALPKRAPPALKSPGRGGAEHKYLQHLVKRLAEERGFRATIEAPAGAGQVDVLLERDGLRVGVEVSVTTDAAHEAENLRKCVAAGFTHVVCVSAEKKMRSYLTDIAAAEFAASCVHVVPPEDVLTVLEGFDPPQLRESVVRGYKVKVTRQTLSASDASAKRSAIAAVVARTMKR